MSVGLIRETPVASPMPIERINVFSDGFGAMRLTVTVAINTREPRLKLTRFGGSDAFTLSKQSATELAAALKEMADALP